MPGDAIEFHGILGSKIRIRLQFTHTVTECPIHAFVPYSAEFTVAYCTMYCTRFNAEYLAFAKRVLQLAKRAGSDK